MGQEKNAENIPFLRSTQPKSTERVPVVELSGYQGRESLEAVHLRAVEGKTARSEPDIGAGCGARTSETLKRNSQRTFSPSFDS